jgi:hypothetical protein
MPDDSPPPPVPPIPTPPPVDTGWVTTELVERGHEDPDQGQR